MDGPGQVPEAKLHRREFHADLKWRAPGGGLDAGVAKRPLTKLADQPALLGEWNKGRGRHQPAPRMMPAQQSLEAENRAVDARLRLVIERKLAMCDRRAQIVLERVPFAQGSVHLVVEKSDDVASVGFGAIERGVGVGDKSNRIGGIGRIHGGADAQSYGDLLSGISKISATARSTRSACVAAVAGCSPPFEISVNSSPPTRAIKAPCAAPSSRREMAQRTRRR